MRDESANFLLSLFTASYRFQNKALRILAVKQKSYNMLLSLSYYDVMKALVKVLRERK